MKKYFRFHFHALPWHIFLWSLAALFISLSEEALNNWWPSQMLFFLIFFFTLGFVPLCCYAIVERKKKRNFLHFSGHSILLLITYFIMINASVLVMMTYGYR